jgi:glucose dehydrogenase
MRGPWWSSIHIRAKQLTRVSSVALLACAIIRCGSAPEESFEPNGVDWPMYRADLAGTGYSPLTQVTAGNVSTLTRAWTYSLRSDGHVSNDRREPRSQVTPIVVNGVMYLPAADRVVALDPTTGNEIWRHVTTDGAPSRRGVAYWPGDEEGGLSPRIVFTTSLRLVALDAMTGSLVDGFGDRGLVDLVVPYNSVPLVFGDVVVVGANTPRGTIGGVGNARAYDVRSGAKLWEFSSVAQPGTLGNETWAEDSWRERLGANAWPFYFTVDQESGLIFLPLASPIPGAYGGDREGANLFGNSVVAADIRTGEYKWHFQTIRHDLWDADPPAPPVLFDVARDGLTIRALGITTKSGYLYILDRETGEPLFGVDERSVPASDVPGEIAYPTQPFPVKPPPMARVTYSPADLVTAADTSDEHEAACKQLVESLGEIYNAGPFTPWVYRSEDAPSRTTLNFPGVVGGPNWGGVAFDPHSEYLFVVTQNIGALGWMEPAGEEGSLQYEKVVPGQASFDVEIGGARLPCQKPPWGELIAVEAQTGEVAWRRPLGITEQLPIGKQNTGRPSRAAAIVTASGLLFVAGSDDNRFRAFETTTGDELWVTTLERHGNANPFTYMSGERQQFIGIVATDTLVVFTLAK